jgi:uncharacterized RDD family membrane protein YckC
MEMSAYQEPAHPEQGSAIVDAEGELAGFWLRFGGAIIDGILLGIVGIVLTVALKGAGTYIDLLLGLVYFVFFEGGPSGQTLGKRAVGVRVVSLDGGGSIGYGRAFVRWLGRYLSALIITWATCGCCGTRRTSAGMTSSPAISS